MKKKVLYPAIVIIWMALILSFSSDTATKSNLKSNFIVDKVAPIAKKIEGKFEVNMFKEHSISYYVRKSAHMFNYFVLASLILITLYKFKVRGVKLYLSTLMLCIVFSSLDEYYQTFIPGRSGQLKDVGIDNIGTFTALALLFLVKHIKWPKRITKKNSKYSYATYNT